MEYKELGKIGIKVSAIGLGTWQWGSREWGWNRSYGKKDVMEAFEKALELGINFIDTAEIYGWGKSEELVGEAIRGRREQVVIATKVSPINLSYRRVQKAAERSLRRLGVDVIDLYQVHFPNPIMPIGSTMKAMKKLVQEGKVRCVGVSNFNLKKLKAAERALAPLDLASNQVKYNLLDREIEKDLLPHATNEKILIIAYSPLAQGLLTGKYKANSTPGSFVQRLNPRFSSRNLSRLAELTLVLSKIGEAHGKTPSQVALNWVIRRENVVAIPGVKKADFVIDDAGATDWRLTNSENATLENVAGVKFDRLSALPNLLRALRG